MVLMDNLKQDKPEGTGGVGIMPTSSPLAPAAMRHIVSLSVSAHSA